MCVVFLASVFWRCVLLISNPRSHDMLMLVRTSASHHFLSSLSGDFRHHPLAPDCSLRASKLHTPIHIPFRLLPLLSLAVAAGMSVMRRAP